MADGVTPPILNPESVSRYEGLFEVGRCQAANKRQKGKNEEKKTYGVFFESLAEAYSGAYPCASHCS
jgi:hypothetical protein